MGRKVLSHAAFLLGSLLLTGLPIPASADSGRVTRKPEDQTLNIEEYIHQILESGETLSHPRWPWFISATVEDRDQLRAIRIVYGSGGEFSVTHAQKGKMRLDHRRRAMVLELSLVYEDLPNGTGMGWETRIMTIPLPADFGMQDAVWSPARGR